MKRFNKNFVTKMFVAFAMAICLVTTGVSSITAFAASNEVTTYVEPRRTVIYPVSGYASGNFTGIKSSVAEFNLPSGNIHISYSYESPNRADCLCFELNGEIVKKFPLSVINANVTEGNVYLSQAGRYKVYISSVSNGDLKSFAYSLSQ